MIYSLKDRLPKGCKEDIINWRTEGATSTICSDNLLSKYGIEVTPRAILNWFKEWKVEVCSIPGIKIDTGHSINKEMEIENRIKKDTLVDSLKTERDHYKRLYESAIHSVSGMDKIIHKIEEVSKPIPEVEVIFKASKSQARTVQTAVAPLCDLHIGEYVDYDQMAGLNQYNIDIFNRRLKGWASLVVSLTEFRRQYAPINELVVPLLGDMVSGEIQEEITKTNEANLMGQMIRGAHMIAQSLVFLSQYFEKIYVPCVVGNHGRMTRKPASKDRYVDWDYLLYQWIAVFTSKNPQITFSIPKSFMHVFRVADKNVLMLHGDSIKMWQSIPYYGITRAIAQLRQVLQFRRGLEEDLLKVSQQKGGVEETLTTLASYFDSVLLGHFHKHDEIDIGSGEAIIAGCMKGGDEFALSKLHTMSKPKQILTYWHPKHGYIGKDIMYLDRFDNSSDMFVDVIPEVWSDAKLIE